MSLYASLCTTFYCILMDDYKLSFYYQNCRGIRSKLHLLYMNILSFSYDVIILSETWLTPNILDNEFIDDRYIVFRCDRDRLATGKRDGGGVLIAVLRELRPTKATHPPVTPLLSML